MTSVPGYPGHYHSISWKVVFPACCCVWIEPVFVCPFDILNISISNSLLETCFFLHWALLAEGKTYFVLFYETNIFFYMCTMWTFLLKPISACRFAGFAATNGFGSSWGFPRSRSEGCILADPKSDMEVLTDQRKPSIYFNIFQYINIHLDTFGIYRLDTTFCMIKVYCYIFLSFLKCSRFIFNFSCLFGLVTLGFSESHTLGIS